MKKVVLLTMAVVCFGIMACTTETEESVASGDTQAESQAESMEVEFDSSAGIESVLNGGSENAEIDSMAESAEPESDELENDAEVETSEAVLLTETEEIKTDLHTYKATLFRNEDTQEVVGWEVEVYNGDTLMQTIYYDHDEFVACIPDLDQLIWEEDVNFDGTKDILIWQGHYGTHGDLGYRCYLANADSGLYEWCPAFQEIPNPKVDKEQQLICGWNRSGGTYDDTFYRYNGNTFVLTRRDMYAWDDASEEYLLTCSLDASVEIYTETDYALVGTYEGTSGQEYSLSIYTSGDGVGECVDIGNIALSDAESWENGYLYKISEKQYYVPDYFNSTAYYLFAQLQDDVWVIEIRDREGNVLDTLTQTEHYEY